MPEHPDQYRLVLFEAPDDPSPIRALFARVTGSHPTDVAQWVARAPGPWPWPLPADQSRALLDGLYALRIPAEAWRVDAFPALAPARPVREVACDAEGLKVLGLRDELRHWVPWGKLELISAGWIAAEDEFRRPQAPGVFQRFMIARKLFNGIAPGHDRRKLASRIIREATGEVLLVRRDPLLCLKLDQEQLNYAPLGDRRRPTARENFLETLREIAARANDAYLTYPTRALLAGEEPAPLEFPDPQALLDYTTHRLLWSWYRRDRERAELQGEAPTEA